MDEVAKESASILIPSPLGSPSSKPSSPPFQDAAWVILSLPWKTAFYISHSCPDPSPHSSSSSIMLCSRVLTLVTALSSGMPLGHPTVPPKHLVMSWFHCNALICGECTFSTSSWLPYVWMLSHFSPLRSFAIPWTIAHQAPLSMGFSRQEYWNGVPCPPPGDLHHPGTKPNSLMSPALAGGFFTISAFYSFLPPTITEWGLNQCTLVNQWFICSLTRL